jgi:hypothetical protein
MGAPAGGYTQTVRKNLLERAVSAGKLAPGDYSSFPQAQVNAALVESYAKHKNVSAVARDFSISRGMIRRFLLRAGVEPSGKPVRKPGKRAKGQEL